MAENRATSYKFGVKNDKDARRKSRQTESIQLRKTAREEQMLKRRNVCMGKFIKIIVQIFEKNKDTR
jgi:hypothetical protein